MTDKDALEGISGWLWLVALGIVATPIRLSVIVADIYSELFASGFWHALNDRLSGIYNEALAKLVAFEVGAHILLIAIWLIVGYLFFARREAFPRWYIGAALFGLFFVLVDAYLAARVVPGMNLIDSESAPEIVRAVLLVAVWVPYMLVSKRVKATFVR